MLKYISESPDVEIHLIISRAAEKTLHVETDTSVQDLKKLAHYSYHHLDIGARLSSGSFLIDGMVVAPCSIQTMSAIAYGGSSNLIVRAADVTLKERRRLILMVRETPFHLGHLRTMAALTEMGAIIAPPIPSFYQHPQTIQDIVDQSVERVLDLLAIPNEGARRWDGQRTNR